MWASFWTFLMSFLDKRSVTSFLILVFLTYFLINERWNIYEIQRVKRLESLSLIVAIITITFGLFASLDDIEELPKYFALSAVIISNLVFFSVGIRNLILIKSRKLKKIIEQRRSRNKSEILGKDNIQAIGTKTK